MFACFFFILFFLYCCKAFGSVLMFSMHLGAVNQVAVFEVIPKTCITSQKLILDGIIHTCIGRNEIKRKEIRQGDMTLS